MSDQEKQSGGNAVEGSVMMIEKTIGGRLKQPYRLNDLQDDTDHHQKRPRASIVPSVAEELKYFTEDTTSSENEMKKRKECEGVPLQDSQRQNITKKLTSTTEKKDHSPESITLQTIEVDKKKGAKGPIPDVSSTVSELVAAEKEAAARADEDSVTEEVEELQTPEIAKKHSEWKCKENSVKKKEISWNNDEKYMLRDLGTNKKSETCMLNRKASVGPCFKNIAPFVGPSGITICLPKKSLKCMQEPSGINVNISRKSLEKSKSTVNEVGQTAQKKMNTEDRSVKVNSEDAFAIFFDNVKERVCNVQNKIKNFFRS